jgi:hypothetical protein
VATNRFGPDAPQADELAPQLVSLAIAQEIAARLR